MVGVGVNQGHCLFYRHTKCMGISEGVSGELGSNFIATTPSSLKTVRRFVKKESDMEGFRVRSGGTVCVGLRAGGLIFRGEQRSFSIEG